MDAQTIAAYNAHAQRYDEETKDFWNKFPRTFINAFIRERPTNTLDIGSGPGRDALLLKEQGIKVTCLDAAQSMREITETLGFTSLDGDCLELPVKNEAFEGVWAYTSLLHIPKKDLPKSLQEIHRVLKRQGIFGIGLIEGQGECYRTTEKIPEPRFFSWYTQEEIRDALKRANFKIIFEEIIQPHHKRYIHTLAKKA